MVHTCCLGQPDRGIRILVSTLEPEGLRGEFRTDSASGSRARCSCLAGATCGSGDAELSLPESDEADECSGSGEGDGEAELDDEESAGRLIGSGARATRFPLLVDDFAMLRDGVRARVQVRRLHWAAWRRWSPSDSRNSASTREKSFSGFKCHRPDDLLKRPSRSCHSSSVTASGLPLGFRTRLSLSAPRDGNQLRPHSACCSRHHAASALSPPRTCWRSLPSG